MVRSSNFGRAAAFLAAVMAPAPTALAQTFGTGFVVDDVADGFGESLCIRFVGTSDLLVAEKSGVVWDIRDGTLRTKAVINLAAEVLNNGDRGLMSLAVDPDFSANGYLYLLYVVDPNGDGSDDEQESFGRLTRFTCGLDVNGNIVADPASRLVLLGATWPQGIPSLHLSHAPGDMHFATDGSLLLSTGDGAHFDLTDPGGFDPGGFGAGKFDASEDIGAFRAQSLTSLAGKILRIDRATGNGLSDNPFFTGNAADNQSRIWAMGLRNPFRFCLVPGTGPVEQLYVSNVGWDKWESVFSCTGGENFGWPCFEGPEVSTTYDTINLGGACSDPSLFTPPFWYYHHYLYDPNNPDFTGQCTSSVCVYAGTKYPASYVGRLFLSDYGADWIRTLLVINGDAAQSDLFGTDAGRAVDFAPDPVTGDLYFCTLHGVRRVRYTADLPPIAVATVTPTFGPSPLQVSFDASASSDPEGGALTFDWDFGDGTHSSQAVDSHTYTTSGVVGVVLTLTDPAGNKSSLSKTIAVDDSPPTIVSLDSPAPGSFYTVGQSVSFDATVADVEDDLNGIPIGVEWVVDLVHDHHVHPAWATLTGAHTSYVPPVHGHGVYLHVTLRLTDSAGLQTAQEFALYDVNSEPEPHLVSVSNVSPRVGHTIQVTGHVHFAGKGDADLAFDWGDGTVDRFRASHLEDRSPSHRYTGPGRYSLRFTTSDANDADTVLQPIDVQPLFPQVAIFAPLTVEHWIPIADQWTLATDLVADLHAAGFDAKLYGAADQAALQTWMNEDLHDAPRDWLVFLDVGASVAYAGENSGSLAETWLAAGNGIAWTGYYPFSQYLGLDGIERSDGAGKYALDELLNASKARLDSGSGAMLLGPAAADLPALQPFTSDCAMRTTRLGTGWSVARLYASTGTIPAISDALVVRDAVNGGEYAQFHCVDDATLPREAVLRDFLLTHVFTNLPDGPVPVTLLSPPPRARVTDTQPTLTWNAGPGATSWLVEVALDAAFTQPVFTATVERGATVVQRVVSVKVATRLEPGSQYRWRVTARNNYGTSSSGVRGFHVATAGSSKK